MMTVSTRSRTARRLMAGAITAALACGGLVLTAAPPDTVRLVGVSAQLTAQTTAIMIEASQPVAYVVSRPDPLTLLVDLRNVQVASAINQVRRSGPIAGVTLEQETTIDGKALARVRIALASRASYTTHSARNVIRLDLSPEASPVSAPAASTPIAVAQTPSSFNPTVTDGVAALPGTPSAIAALSMASPVMAPAAGASAVKAVGSATVLEHVKAARTRTGAIVTLSGNGTLTPSALTESDQQPRRLVVDFPDVSSTAPARTAVSSDYVKQVRVALNSRSPLVTRVVMDISPNATYHAERSGPDGRDLAIVFEGQTTGSILVAPPTSRGDSSATPDEDRMSLEQALANGAALAPKDPIVALNGGAGQSGTTALLQPRQAPATPAQPPATPAQPPAPKPATPSPQSPAGATPTVVTQAPGTGPRQYTGAPINFDFEDADLRAVLRVFSQESGLNMIIDPAVQGRVNVVLNDVPWDQALEQILRSNKLGYTVEGNIIRIAPLTVLADEQAQTQKLNEAKALAGELQVQTFALSYAKADTLAPLLLKSALSARGQIQVDARTNTLILMDLPDRLQTAQTLIGTLDKPQPQVEVEARVVQTTRDYARALGIQWGFNGRANSIIGNTTSLAFPNNGSIGGRVGTTAPNTGFTQGATDPSPNATPNGNSATVVNLPAPGATSAIGLALGAINGAFNLDVALSALENTGKGRILSTPRLTTQNNQPAEVAQGVQIPIQTIANNTVSVSFKDATLKLDVTPQITAANTVIMNIQIANETPDFTRAVNGIPPINTQRALTTVQVNDGATTVIGGIFVSNEESQNNRTPTLYRVPLLKWLFQNSSVTDSSNELLIFITPRILR